MSFRLVLKSVTLNDLERRNGVILRYFSEFGYLPGVLRKSSRPLSHLLMSSCTNGRPKMRHIQFRTRLFTNLSKNFRQRISHTCTSYRIPTKFTTVKGLASRYVFPEFGEVWSGGPAILCGDMHQSFTDAIATFLMSRVCLPLAAFPHYCTDPHVSWRNGRGCPLVVHYWEDLQSVLGFRCYDNIARTRNASECLYSLYAW